MRGTLDHVQAEFVLNEPTPPHYAELLTSITYTSAIQSILIHYSEVSNNPKSSNTRPFLVARVALVIGVCWRLQRHFDSLTYPMPMINANTEFNLTSNLAGLSPQFPISIESSI